MSDVNFSKKGDRVVTPFVGQELLYDYVRGQLDPERVQALERLLQENRELRAELEKIKEGLEYVRQLGQTRVSDVLTESVRTPSTYLHVLLAKTRFTEWPEGVKLALEGFLIAVGALALIVVIPWGKVLSLRHAFDRDSVVLTEVTKTQAEQQDAEGPESKDGKFVFDDEGKPAEPAKKVAAAAPAPTPEAKAAAPAPTPKAQAKAPAPVEAKAPKTEPPVETAGLAEAAPDSGKKQGFLYRGTIKVTNMADTVPKLVSFIDSIGGRKAGEVELGWRKGEGAYFHFTVPEAKYQALLQEFNEYGSLKIQKEPHPRVMPDGIIRLIITVDEKSKK